MYGQDIWYSTQNILPYIEKCVVYWSVKIYELPDLRACVFFCFFFNAPQMKSIKLLITPEQILKCTHTSYTYTYILFLFIRHS